MKRRKQRGNTVLAGIAGIAVVLALALGLNLVGFQGQVQSQSEPTPLLPSPDMTATPTVPAAPAAPAAPQSGLLASPQLAGNADLGQWEFVDVGVRLDWQRSVWRVTNGALLQDRTADAGNPNNYDTIGLIGSPEWADYTVRASFFDEGNGMVGLAARYQDGSYYRFRLVESSLEGPKLLLELVDGSDATVLASADAGSYQFRSWNEIALTVDGSRLAATLNGKPILTAEDATLSSGRAGVYTRAVGEVRFTNVVVAQ